MLVPPPPGKRVRSVLLARSNPSACVPTDPARADIVVLTILRVALSCLLRQIAVVPSPALNGALLATPPRPSYAWVGACWERKTSGARIDLVTPPSTLTLQTVARHANDSSVQAGGDPGRPGRYDVPGLLCFRPWLVAFDPPPGLVFVGDHHAKMRPPVLAATFHRFLHCG